MIEFQVNPIAKPRMTRSDKWKKRKACIAYWDYKDQLSKQALLKKFSIPESNYWLKFYIPMPDSWSQKKKQKMIFTPHQQKPDKDNLEKGFLDALCEDDSYIWDGRVSKYWSDTGKIIVEAL